MSLNLNDWLQMCTHTKEGDEFNFYFCQVLNGEFTVATDETLENVILSVSVSDVKIIELNKEKDTCFSIHLKNEDVYIFKCSDSMKTAKWIRTLSSSSPKPANSPTLKDFIFEKKIGSGHSGEVILAQNVHTKQYFALKSIPKQHFYNPHKIFRAISERNIMMNTSHPFITKLISTFQSDYRLFLVLEFVPGGDLAYHLNRNVVFERFNIKLYLAEIAIALSYLHKMGIVFRDLKPSNILIDADGHIKLTDFGLAKYFTADPSSPRPKLKCNNNTFCGTNEYLAPEMIEGKNYSFAVDWWAFGVLAYQMLCDMLPFRSLNLNRLFEMITTSPLKFHSQMDEIEKDFLEKLLMKNPEERLGCGKNGESEIFHHKFFDGIDWDKVYSKEYEPTFHPEINHLDITSNFENKITSQTIDSTRESNQNQSIYIVSDFSFSASAELIAAC